MSKEKESRGKAESEKVLKVDKRFIQEVRERESGKKIPKYLIESYLDKDRDSSDPSDE